LHVLYILYMFSRCLLFHSLPGAARFTRLIFK
jgi:hypothetical protein